jgi:hypothetical protein
VSLTLLQIVQKSCRLLALPVPETVVDSRDIQVQQLYELANEEGEELADVYDWQVLRQQYTFVTQASAVQTSAVPGDWNRFISNSFFNRTTQRSVLGPITPQQWQSIQAQPQLNRVFLAFIQRAGQFLITPTPTPNETIAYEYVTRNWVYDVVGDPKDSFTRDDDETYLDPRLIILGIRWRFLKSKGLEYGEDFKTYQTERNQKMARDGGNTELSTTGSDGFILSPNVPEGGFPGP